jgi:hypothetical protein
MCGFHFTTPTRSADWIHVMAMNKNYSRKFALVSDALEVVRFRVTEQNITGRELYNYVQKIETMTNSLVSDMIKSKDHMTTPTAVSRLNELANQLLNLRIDIADGVITENDICKSLSYAESIFKHALHVCVWTGKTLTVKVKK